MTYLHDVVMKNFLSCFWKQAARATNKDSLLPFTCSQKKMSLKKTRMQAFDKCENDLKVYQSVKTGYLVVKKPYLHYDHRAFGNV